MQDRVSLYPGRVKLAPVSGQENTYDMVRADSPTQDGTTLNKDSLLKDATAALFGLGADAVPDNAFQQIKTLIDNVQSSANSKARVQTGSYVGTGTYGKNNPCSLTFDFAPKLVIIRKTKSSDTGFFVYNSERYSVFGGYSSTVGGPCSQSNNTISWYYAYNDQGPRGQLNEQGVTYVWVSIG